MICMCKTLNTQQGIECIKYTGRILQTRQIHISKLALSILITLSSLWNHSEVDFKKNFFFLVRIKVNFSPNKIKLCKLLHPPSWTLRSPVWLNYFKITVSKRFLSPAADTRGLWKSANNLVSGWEVETFYQKECLWVKGSLLGLGETNLLQ